MNEFQAANLRLLESGLPRRRHEWKPKEDVQRPAVSDYALQRAREMESDGVPRRQISDATGISRFLLCKHLGPSKAGRKVGSPAKAWKE